MPGEMKENSKRFDEVLGLHRVIARRDFLNGGLLSLGGLWVASCTPLDVLSLDGKPLQPQSRWDGNTEDVFTAAHAIRDGDYDDPNLAAEETGELFDLVVIGGGFSGLAAAYYFHQAKAGKGKVLVLENHRMFGGNARRDEFTLKGKTLHAPQASVVAQDPSPALAPSPAVEKIFQELNIDLAQIRVPEESYAFSVFRDRKSDDVPPRWYANVFEAPLPAEVKQDYLAFFQSAGVLYENSGWKEEFRELDKFTFKDYVETERKWNPEVYRLMQPELAGFFGFPDAISAALVYALYGGKGPRSMYFFPGGNSGFLRHIVKSLIPSAIAGTKDTSEIINGPINFAALDREENAVRLRLSTTAVRVEHEGRSEEATRVRVTFSHRRNLYRLRARAVIMAGGGYITKHVVRDLPEEKLEAYRRFSYAPVLWVNVALNNSRALDKANLNAMSTYHEGFGAMLFLYEKMSSAGFDPGRDPNRPNVVGIGAPRFYLGAPYREQETRGRVEMLSTSFQTYERQVREDLTRLLGPWGFDPKQDIEAIVLNRWGHHGYVFGYPGFFTGDAVAAAQKPYGRIAFAHTDLHRFSSMIGAIEQGHRAAQEVLERI